MLQERRLSCSCQEATVSLPPSLADVPVLPPLGVQATSSTLPMPATASSRNERWLAPLIRPPSGSSRADQRRGAGPPAPAAAWGESFGGGGGGGEKQPRLS